MLETRKLDNIKCFVTIFCMYSKKKLHLIDLTKYSPIVQNTLVVLAGFLRSVCLKAAIRPCACWKMKKKKKSGY